VEQLASRTKLKNDVVVLAGLRKVKELDDIRMIDLPHDLHLLKDVGSLRETLVSLDLLSGRAKTLPA